jgi:hypothetical protein
MLVRASRILVFACAILEGLVLLCWHTHSGDKRKLHKKPPLATGNEIVSGARTA